MANVHRSPRDKDDPMKSIRPRKKSLQKAYDIEKKARDCKRILLVTYVWINGMNASESARRLKKSRSWGITWAKRYGKRGLAGLQNLPRSGRPSKARPGITKNVQRMTRRRVPDGGGHMHPQERPRQLQHAARLQDHERVGLYHEGAGGTAHQPGRQ